MNEAIENELRAYCKQQQDIVLAFLFGSQAKGYARPTSDWDVGVYLTDHGITRKQEIWRDIEKIVHAEIDLIVLNNTPACIAWPIVGSGKELAIKDHDRYMQEIERLSEEADAWYQTTDEYYKIFNRSSSLAPRDRVRLQEITIFLEGALREYERFKALTQEHYMSETDVKRSVEHWIEPLVNQQFPNFPSTRL